MEGKAVKGLWGLVLVGILAAGAECGVIPLDFSARAGRIRPLHGVNGGPICGRGVVDLSRYYRELRFPLARLHDVPWANFQAVDVSLIFRDFRNPPGEAESFDFAPTDDFLSALVRTGTPVLYRLGESIEHTPRKYRVHPPGDSKKWAEICFGIVRHYDEGWAKGFKYKIRYWEIWNEPDNKPAMWTGTDEQFLELFEVTAKTLKSRRPLLKVGGPGLANAGRIEGGKFVPSNYARKFLSFCRRKGVPLDFFSWHRYTKDPSEYAKLAEGVREMLDGYGFTKTESFLDEWNFLPGGSWKSLTKGGQGLARKKWLGEMSGPAGAAFDAWVLMALQDEPVDMANFFTADTQMLGMFSEYGVPKKNFYAFKAFRVLLDTPLRVRTPRPEKGGVAVCAGIGREGARAAVLLSKFYARPGSTELAIRNLPWAGPTGFEVYLVDARRDFDLVRRGTLDEGGNLALPELKAPSVVLVKLFGKKAR